MPKTVNTGFVCFKKASTVRTLTFFSSQAQSFTNKQEYYKKMEYYKKQRWRCTPLLGLLHFLCKCYHYFGTSHDRCV